ncbi:sensor histidine kinase [Clostridium lundense]|uniref:sensor histidine kinase n=1 Tax=Clostridium lundense TaxID=319475 RepID=UPI000482F7A0|nr:HAMP domain-containing sensor histidine kinase [Clostridium lundense]
MIKYIKREPLLKKIFAITISSLIFMSLLVFYSHFLIMNSIHRQHIELCQEIVGKLTIAEPEKEIKIINTVLHQGDKNVIKHGQDVLNKYGYDVETQMWEDSSFKKYFYKFSIYDLASITFIILFTILVLLFSFSYYMKRLEKFSVAVDHIIDGNFKLSLEENEEGILSQLASRLQQMAKILNLSLINLAKEKENIKSLVTDISHQVKTPLSSIKLFNTLLLEEELSKEEREEFLFRSEKEINKLEWLFNSLIKMSRMEAGMIEIKRELRDLKETVYEAIDGVKAKAREKNIDIVVQNMINASVYHDPKWTKEAIFNVLENAVKYADENGKVTVNMELMESYVRIDIQDNGIGIPEKEFNNIFKRFYRGQSKKVKASEGSGVGLYLTRKILEEQYGSITVDSVEGIGTKFSLYLQNCK